MKSKLLLMPLIFSAFFSYMTVTSQTTLVPGDIAIVWYQADTPDTFAFTTFVDLQAGTEIIFTDCGAVPAGTFDPIGCGEGATVFTAPAGGVELGEIIVYDDSNPSSEFSNYSGDAAIISGSGPSLSTGGDQITVIQGSGVSPSFIFLFSASSTTFSGDDNASTTETNLFTGLSDTGLPRTAVAVGSGPAPSQEFDNSVYNGSFTFATVEAAKIALTNPANYQGSNGIIEEPYASLVAGIPEKLNITALSVDEFDLNSAIKVFPNPSNGVFTIKNSGVSLQTLMVTDLNGRTVVNYNLEGTRTDKELDLRSVLTSGMYFLTIATDDASTVRKIVIK